MRGIEYYVLYFDHSNLFVVPNERREEGSPNASKCLMRSLPAVEMTKCEGRSFGMTIEYIAHAETNKWIGWDDEW